METKNGCHLLLESNEDIKGPRSALLARYRLIETAFWVTTPIMQWRK
jgi:hypothetical protein